MKRIRILFLLGAMLACSAVKSQTDITLTISDFTIEANGAAILTIDSDVKLGEFCSFQFDVMLPEGITMPYNYNPDEEEEQYGYYDEDEEEWVSAATCGVAKSSHTLNFSQINGGYRFICTSMSLAKFKTGNTNVLTLQLVASPELMNGIYTVTLGSKVLFGTGAVDDEGTIPNWVPGTMVMTGSTKMLDCQFTMGSAGWGTLMLPFEAELPNDLTAYECTSVKNGATVLTVSNKIQANTPYIMEGEAGEYNFTGVPTMRKLSYEVGTLTGVYTDTEITEGYVLQRIDGKVAFYRVDEEMPITVPAYRCYLNVADANANAQMIRLNDTTGIETVKDDAEEEIYDLMGKKWDTPLDKGVYVKGNKKIIVR